MKSDRKHNKNIKLKIMKFFYENPSTIDSARGVAAWIGEDMDNVKKCLDILEKERVLISHKTNFVTGYSLTSNKNALKKIKSLIIE